MKAWTDATDTEADVLFRTLTEHEIRTRQDLCSQQIRMAYDQRNADAMTNLHRMEDALQREMMRRLNLANFGTETTPAWLYDDEGSTR